MTSSSFGDQTNCECLVNHLQGAAPGTLSILDPNPRKGALEHLSGTFSLLDRMQANARVQTDLDIDNLESAHRPHWLVTG